MIRLMLYAATIQMTYVNSSCLKYVLLSSLTACVQIFLSQASDEIQSLLGLHTSALNEYHAMITYFGEDPNSSYTGEIFTIFATFVAKFEVRDLKK